MDECIPTVLLIEGYRNNFNIDVSEYFAGLDEVAIYRCMDTGYRFFYPFQVAGDSAFYEHFQEFDWYYMPQKWEHREALLWMAPGMRVLEVGCARGDFLKTAMKEQGVNVVGLELNKSVSGNGNFEVLHESVEQHSVKNRDCYEMVCAFQVLEHIPAIKPFLEACTGLLKPGGVLVLSVPNNDSFLKHSLNYLNAPPHHMGLWNISAFREIQGHFNLELIDYKLEPPQAYHRDYFVQTTSALLKQRYRIPFRVSGALKTLFYPLSPKNYKAFTLFVVFRKR